MGKLNKLVFVGIFLILVFGTFFITAVFGYYKLYPNDESIYIGYLFNVTPKEISYNPLEQMPVVFVPVMSSLEWNQFVANYPSYVTVSWGILKEPDCFTLSHCENYYDLCRDPMKCLGGECCYDGNQRPPPVGCPSTDCSADVCITRTDCERAYPNCAYTMYCANDQCCGNAQTNCPAYCV
jgi:hypothetical protein